MSLVQLASLLEAAADWSFARSSGPGGQNVNKVHSKAQLSGALDALTCLSPHQRALVEGRLAPRIVEGCLTIQVQDTRSQLENRQLALARLEVLIREAVVPVRARRATKPTRGSQERRLEGKKKASQTKRSRGRSYED